MYRIDRIAFISRSATAQAKTAGVTDPETLFDIVDAALDFYHQNNGGAVDAIRHALRANGVSVPRRPADFGPKPLQTSI